jgi:hypothetical protein
MLKVHLLLLLLISSTTLFAQKKENDQPEAIQELQGVTFGFGTGFSHIGGTVHSYSLTTDTAHALKAQKLSKTSFVISSELSIKFGKISTAKNSNKILKANGGEAKPADRLAVNVALNLLEINSDNLSFNKNIDGGIGLGYFLNDYIQVAAFYDLVRIRQLRDHILKSYLDKSIPSGKEVFNALDEKNNDLFYDKTFTGISVKVIFSLGNKKTS